jgi:hypothetical protein
MNNEPVALTQADILGILQDANSVPLGQPIFNSSEEYNKLKAIIESAIRYTHLADESFDRTASHMAGKYVSLYTHPSEHDLGVAEAIGFDKGYQAGLRKAQEQ